MPFGVASTSRHCRRPSWRRCTCAWANAQPGYSGSAWGLIPVLRDKRKTMKEALRSSPVAYLMRVEEELKPQTLKNWIWQGARKFCFDV